MRLHNFHIPRDDIWENAKGFTWKKKHCYNYKIKYIRYPICFTYSLPIALVQRTFLTNFVQLHVDLFAQGCDRISTKTRDDHRSQICNVGGLSECGYSTTYSILEKFSTQSLKKTLGLSIAKLLRKKF